MATQDNYAHAKFGIDEIYIHEGFPNSWLEKIHQRAAFCLDAENNIVQKLVTHDMILIFYKQVPTASKIYQFLKFLDQDVNKKSFIKSNTLCNEEEMEEVFSAIKSKKYVLVTHRMLLKDTFCLG